MLLVRFPMRRRAFITLVGSVAAWPLTGRAQPADRMRRVGLLIGTSEDEPQMKPRLAAFRQELQRLGWSEGRNVRFDYRFAGGSAERAQLFAKELVALQPDVIFAGTTAVTAATQRETRTIPIVFGAVSDPIGSGFVSSLAKPGGNLTGLQQYEEGITGKWLAMLKEIAPRLTRAAFLANPKTSPYDYFLRTAAAAAPLLAIELVPSEVATATDIQRAIESFARVPNGGLILPPDTTTSVHRNLIIALAARHRLPAVYAFRYFVADGGLISYGVDLLDVHRRVAYYVDRILRGDKPADLPVQAPVKYETIINLKTAKALGLNVPPGLTIRADEVIE
jgi:putative ABC transport system substrate-binding protein